MSLCLICIQPNWTAYYSIWKVTDLTLNCKQNFKNNIGNPWAYIANYVTTSNIAIGIWRDTLITQKNGGYMRAQDYEKSGYSPIIE